MGVLTKSDILNGVNTPHEEYFEELDGSLILYPLSDGEIEEIENAALEGQTVRGKPGQTSPEDIEFDVSKSAKAQYRSNCLAVSTSLSKGNEKWSIKDVQNMRPAGIVAKIAAKVYSISKGKKAIEEAETFRKDGERS